MNEIRFIDLFSGIGGFRLGLEKNNRSLVCANGSDKGKKTTWLRRTTSAKTGDDASSNCGRSIFRHVWSNDFNKYANQIYTKRFGEENHHSGDITRIDAETIPSHDLLCGGFPCQAFSVAGKRRGFKETRGTLFFEICRIAEHHRPSMLLLENVKGLLSHDGGRTFATITDSLEELGYRWEYQVLNSKHFGVPQNRERVFIIGHSRNGGSKPIFPITETDQLINESCGEAQEEGTRIRVANTLSARYYKDGSENLIGEPFIKNIPHGYNTGFEKELPSLKANSGAQYNELLVQPLRWVRSEKGREARREYQKHGKDKTPFGSEYREMAISDEQVTGAITGALNRDTLLGDQYQIRRLTPVECERLQGFPDGWTEGISDTQRYKCLGNAVTVNVIEYLGNQIRIKLLCAEDEKNEMP